MPLPHSPRLRRAIRAIAFLILSIARPVHAEEPADLAPSKPIDVATSCPNAAAIGAGIVYPIAARRAGVSNAEIDVAFSVAPNGEPTDVVVRSTSQPYFDDIVVSTVRKLRCPGAPPGARIEWHISLRIAP